MANAKVLNADARELQFDRKFDLIYSNPPYRKIGAGKLNPHSKKAVSRHEISSCPAILFSRYREQGCLAAPKTAATAG